MFKGGRSSEETCVRVRYTVKFILDRSMFLQRLAALGPVGVEDGV